MKSIRIKRCDIFCTVIDNYGDIGVSWRLARQLVHEFALEVRLWVDDLASFKRLCPVIDVTQAAQFGSGVEVRHWPVVFPQVEPAELVIETFSCELPERYVASMTEQQNKPVWINLEYLSAEDWVAGCHGLPSPHPQLPLIRYFFFPGFTPETGGLLLERGLLQARDAFQADVTAQTAYWNSLGVPEKVPGELRISLFSYENSALPGLLDAWSRNLATVRCLVPEGRAVPQVAGFFRLAGLQAGDVISKGNLHVHILPFTEQEAYDRLLWACDVNFVRGEDSCVRAQWAGRPFVWHIYPQHDGVHMKKLQALLGLYGKGLAPACFSGLQAFWLFWNRADSAETQDLTDPGGAWNDFMSNWSMLLRHANGWAKDLAGNSLALNLLDFSHKVGTMRAFENQAGRKS